MSFAIRPAEAADWTAIRELLRQAGLPTSDLDENRMRDFLVAESPQADMLGAIGIERYRENALLRSLVINPGARRGGLGRALVERLEATVSVRGVREIWLLTNDAGDFFGRLGYQRRERTEVPRSIRRSEEFAVLCPDTAWLMSRRITS